MDVGRDMKTTARHEQNIINYDSCDKKSSLLVLEASKNIFYMCYVI